jgi:O-antigen/teichoic acid export membrane protein
MQVIGGDATDGAVAVMRIQAPALLATFASFGISTILLVLRRYRELLAINALGLVTVAVVALLLVPGHGAKGAAIAVLAAEWLIVLCQAAVLRRALRNAPAATLGSTH